MKKTEYVNPLSDVNITVMRQMKTTVGQIPTSYVGQIPIYEKQLVNSYL